MHNHIHKVQSNANALTALRGTGHGTWYKIVQRQKGPMPVPGGAGPVMIVTPDDGRRRGMSAERAGCRCPLVLNYNIRKIGINTPHLSSDDSSVLKLLPIT